MSSLLALLLASAAAPQSPPPSTPPSSPPPEAQPATATTEPATARLAAGGRLSQVVCITEFQPGSRIVRRRVCRTRAEWAEHRSEFRQEIERAQQQFQTDYPDGD
jgi:hypothetical protein